MLLDPKQYTKYSTLNSLLTSIGTLIAQTDELKLKDVHISKTAELGSKMEPGSRLMIPHIPSTVPGI